jgi:hypothetical protein
VQAVARVTKKRRTQRVPFFCTPLEPQEEIGRTQQLLSERGRPNRAPHPPPRRDRSHTGRVRLTTVRDGLCLLCPTANPLVVLVDVERARVSIVRPAVTNPYSGRDAAIWLVVRHVTGKATTTGRPKGRRRRPMTMVHRSTSQARLTLLNQPTVFSPLSASSSPPHGEADVLVSRLVLSYCKPMLLCYPTVLLVVLVPLILYYCTSLPCVLIFVCRLCRLPRSRRLVKTKHTWNRSVWTRPRFRKTRP